MHMWAQKIGFFLPNVTLLAGCERRHEVRSRLNRLEKLVEGDGTGAEIESRSQGINEVFNTQGKVPRYQACQDFDLSSKIVLYVIRNAQDLELSRVPQPHKSQAWLLEIRC